MSMPPRSRTGSGPLVAGLIIAAVAGVTAIALAAAGITPQRAWDSFFPVGAGLAATEQGHEIRRLYDIVFYIAVVVFLLVESVIVYSVFRYRRKPGDDTLPPQIHGNNLVEVIWTAIPTVIVAVIFVLSWQTLNAVEAKPPADVHVRAVAARFQWSFDYLDASGNRLFTQNLPQGEGGGMVVPVGEPVLVSLSSPDVIHAFYVPKFLFKRDVVPGKENTFNFTVDEAGTYRGQCAELCGAFHGSMVFEVKAVPAAEFRTWLQAQIDKAGASPTPQPSGEPAASASPGSASPGPSGEASQPPSGVVVRESALNIAFETGQLTAPANAPFQIEFANKDAGVPHNIEIKDAGGGVVFQGETFNGVETRTYDVNALAAGSYTFLCTVHPNMTGTLTVE